MAVDGSLIVGPTSKGSRNEVPVLRNRERLCSEAYFLARPRKALHALAASSPFASFSPLQAIAPQGFAQEGTVWRTAATSTNIEYSVQTQP
jgi:hypothetical protein